VAALEKASKYRHIFDAEKKVAENPRIKDYLVSDRRRKFSNGLFRRYDELDDDS
jgi:glutathione S-transferase